MFRYRWLAVVIAVASVAAACGGGGDEQSEPAPTDAPTTTTTVAETTTTAPPTTSTTTTTTTTTTLPPLQTWALEELEAVGRVVQDGSVALTVARIDGGLVILAVRADTGEELWQAPYSMGGRFPGMGLAGFDISGDTVAHLDGTLSNPRTADLVGRDLTTGEELWRFTAPFGFGAEGCGDVFCAAWVDLARGRYVVSGVDPRTGESVWELDGGDIDYVTDPDLAIVLEPGNRPLIYAIEPATGELLWTVDPEEALGENMTTNYGWNFRRENGVVIATLGRDFTSNDTVASTFGLDETTGELLWRLDETRLTRWRIDSYALASFSEGEEWFSHDTLGVLDPTTGAVQPLVDLPEDDDVASNIVFANGISYGASGDSVFWPDGDDWVGVNTTSGEPEPTPDVLWVTEIEPEDLADLIAGTDRTAWLRGVRYLSIDPSTGDPVDVEPEDIPSFVGPTASGWTVWIDSDGVLRGLETR